jgi:ketosteroid isomerase-like protein
MKKLLSYTTAAFLATLAISNAAPDKNVIIIKEEAVWRAFKNNDASEFKKLIAADVVAVYPDGAHGMQHELDMMPKTKIDSVSFSNYNVTFPGPALAIVTYTAKVSARQDGKDVSGTYQTASVWRMSDDGWQGIFHSELAAAPMKKPAG